jgi:adenylate cyclase
MAKRAVTRNVRSPVLFRCLAIASAHLGREAEAREAAAGLLELEPGFRISEWTVGLRLPPVYVEGLRRAGLPE